MSPKRPKAIIVSVKRPDVSDVEHQASVSELERLVQTLGYEVAERVVQARAEIAHDAVLGGGKLQELAKLTGGTGKTDPVIPRTHDKARQRRERKALADLGAADRVDAADEDDDDQGSSDEASFDEPSSAAAIDGVELIAVDHDVTPSQARNMERATGVHVLDRTGVIIEIFHRHAKSREAKIQVEIARLKYTAPRVRESPSGRERQKGRGAGEAALELDRRKIRDRIAELRELLESIQRVDGVRRAHRRDARRVALVGYTNAGKSSLMRALTGSDVYVENKLFATLDTTVRALKPEVVPRILVSDTVGFIKKLPHDLVASFKSTLDEALEASHLLHLVDASDPDYLDQLETTREVLDEIGAGHVPTTLIFNKIDRLSDEERASLRMRYPEAWQISAHRPEDISWCRERIIELCESGFVDLELDVPYEKHALIGTLFSEGRVLSQEHSDAGTRIVWRGPEDAAGRIRSVLDREQG